MIQIDFFDYNIIKHCKNDYSKQNLINYLKEYFASQEIRIQDLYFLLLNTFIKVSNKSKINDTFKNGLYNIYLNKLYTNSNSLNFSYEDLANLIFTNLELLQIGKIKKNGKFEDFYEVKIDNDIIPISKVETFLKKKEQEQKKKIKN